MMLSKDEKEQYFQVRFKISLITSLFLLTILFYFFPRFVELGKVDKTPVNVKIYVNEVPITSQPKPLPPRRPGKPEAAIPVPGDETKLPDEFVINELPGNVETEQFAAGIPPEIPARPLLEVYPNVKGSSCKGYIRLLLLVNLHGRIGAVEVLENTTVDENCLDMAKKAAFSSRWMPAKVKNKPVESWVTKVYKFNIDK